MSLVDIMQSRIDKCVHGGYFGAFLYSFTAMYKLKRKREINERTNPNAMTNMSIAR